MNSNVFCCISLYAFLLLKMFTLTFMRGLMSSIAHDMHDVDLVLHCS